MIIEFLLKVNIISQERITGMAAKFLIRNLPTSKIGQQKSVSAASMKEVQ